MTAAYAHALADPLAQAYAKAWAEVESWEQKLRSDPRREAQRRRLDATRRQIEHDMNSLDDTARQWLSHQLPRIYLAGGTDLPSGGPGFNWNQAHQEATQRFANGLHTDLLHATQNVRQSTKELIRSVAADQQLRLALSGQDTAVSAGRRMADILHSKGVTALVYKDGSRHGLAEYAQMAIRTTSASAYNYGTLNGAPGVGRWEVFDGPNCGWSRHDDARLANGLVVTRDEALGQPISHPNCRRAFGPRPDLEPKKPGSLGPRTEQDALDAIEKSVDDFGEPERPALRAYRRTRFGEVNGQLRHYEGDPARVDPDLMSKYVGPIDQAMKSSVVRQDITAWRGLSVKALGGRVPQVGMELTDHAYTSVSAERKAAEHFARKADDILLRVKVPAGTHGVRLSEMGDEAEILLDRGISYRVVGDAGPLTFKRFDPALGKQVDVTRHVYDVEVLPRPLIRGRTFDTPEDAQRWVVETYGTKGFSRDERLALKQWQQADFRRISEFLRTGQTEVIVMGGMGKRELVTSLEQWKSGVGRGHLAGASEVHVLEHMPGIFSKRQLPEDVTLWRGADFESLAKADARSLVGTVIQDNSFIATSPSRDAVDALAFDAFDAAKGGNGIVYEIRAKAGQRWVTPEIQAKTGYAEVVLPPGTRFRVLEVHDEVRYARYDKGKGGFHPPAPSAQPWEFRVRRIVVEVI